jgi:hypothetical protein
LIMFSRITDRWKMERGGGWGGEETGGFRQ